MEQQGKFRGVVELIGMVAVAASLVFVGLEIRQNALATRGATQQELAASAQALALLVAETGELSDLLARVSGIARSPGEEILSDFSPGEALRVGSFYLSVFRLWEEAYYQYGLGNLDPELWGGWKTNMVDRLSRDGQCSATPTCAVGERLFWPSMRPRVSEPFRMFVDDLIEAN